MHSFFIHGVYCMVFAARCYASAALALMRCLCVCVSVTFVHCVKTKKNISSRFFHLLVATPF